jgi:hypothetical protein
MFGIGFLLALAAALGVIHALTLIFPTKARPYLWLSVVVIAVSFPFWHYLYPSYREFVGLCARTDLYVEMKTVEVDYAYFDGDSFGAYRQLDGRGFKGFEIKQGQLRYFRYSRSDNWTSPACQRDCANPSVLVWEKTCEMTCLTKTPIPVPEFELKSNFSTTELVEGRLVQQRSAVLAPSGEELAAQHSYIYYPFGTGVARILGLASGDPPKLSCKAQKSTWTLDFLRPRRIQSLKERDDAT